MALTEKEAGAPPGSWPCETDGGAAREASSTRWGDGGGRLRDGLPPPTAARIQTVRNTMPGCRMEAGVVCEFMRYIKLIRMASHGWVSG